MWSRGKQVQGTLGDEMSTSLTITVGKGKSAKTFKSVSAAKKFAGKKQIKLTIRMS